MSLSRNSLRMNESLSRLSLSYFLILIVCMEAQEVFDATCRALDVVFQNQPTRNPQFACPRCTHGQTFTDAHNKIRCLRCKRIRTDIKYPTFRCR